MISYDIKPMTANTSMSIKDEAVVGAAMTVAQGFSSRPPALGIGTALALRGGSQQDLTRLDLELDFSWQPALASVIAEAIDRARSPQAPWITTAPVLLLGENGVGRTHVARRFAHVAGLPHSTLDLQDVEVLERLQGIGRGPDVRIPLAPVLAMAASGCANPVITVLGAETATDSVQIELARMIDPATADRFADNSVGATVDLRQVSWFVQGQQPERIVAPLSRLLRRIELIRPSGSERLLHVAEIIAEAVADENAGASPTGQSLKRLLDSLHRIPSDRSTSHLYDAARSIVRNGSV